MPRKRSKPKIAARSNLAMPGTAALKIQAAEGEKPGKRRFEIAGYTGEPLESQGCYGWEHPVVVDLDGIDVGDGVLPILAEHGGKWNSQQPERHFVVGQSEEAVVEGGQFVVRGVMFESTEAGQEIIQLADEGLRWQASIGARCKQRDFVAEGNSVTVNGRSYEGPVYVSRKTVVREVSIVVIGDDGRTSVVIATGRQSMFPKTFAEWLKANGFEEAGMSEQQKTCLTASYLAAKKMACEEDDVDAEEDDDEEEDSSIVEEDDEEEDVDAEEETETKGKAKAKGKGNKTGYSASGRRSPRTNVGKIFAQEIRKAREAARKEAQKEGARVSTIQALCANSPVKQITVKGRLVNICEHAIASGWSARDTELRLLRAERDHQVSPVPQGGPNFYSPSRPIVNDAVLECAVLQAGNCQLWSDDYYFSTNGETRIRRVPESIQREAQRQLEARYTDQVQQSAHDQFARHGGIGLQQILALGARSGGYRGSDRITTWNLEEILRAAFDPRIRASDGASTVSLQNVLANVLNKFLLQGYLFAEMSWREICGIRPVKDFKPTKSINVFGDVIYQKLNADGQIQHAGLSDEAFANQVDTFARRLGLSRQTIINDDLNALTTAPMQLGLGSSYAINKLVWTCWLNGMGNGPDGSAFWADRTVAANALGSGALNANYISGSTTNLTSASLQTAKQTYDKQVQPNGQPLGLEAEILLIPPELDQVATELLVSDYLIGTGQTSNARQPASNTWKGRFKKVMSRYLSNSSYTGYSTTAWWILTDPGKMCAIEVAFLNGQETPTVQTAQADFDTLGIAIRGFHDFGVAAQNTRAGVKSKGAA